MSEQLQEGLGLYVRFAKNNKIKKRLVTKNGELKMKDATIESELIDFFNVRMDYYDQTVIHMIKLTEITRPDAPDYDFEKAKTAFERLLEFADDLIKIYEEEGDDESVFHATLLYVLMEDIALPRIHTPATMYEYRNAILSAIDWVVRIQSAMSIVLKKICNKEPFNIAEEVPILQHSGSEQHIWMEKTLKTEYYFRSEANYLSYLFLLFLNKKPRVARCQCCGNYFIPKTNKKTLYCDRIISKGKTCKQIAPTLKHKLHVEKDEVLKTFDRVKQKMYKRYERQNDTLGDLPHGLTWQQYQAWHTNASKARDAYVAGKLSPEEAIKIINTTDII